MTRDTYDLIEGYMLACMQDSAHDKEHVYRVLYTALDIAATEPAADQDVLIAACLLHDIGRKEQFANPALDHALVGAEKAKVFLTQQGFPTPFSQAVAGCIRTHRFRSSAPPATPEAKILFDADKLDVTGAVGIARTLFYQGEVGQPLYTVGRTGCVLDGSEDETWSFFREYKYKLEGLYARFFTARGQQLALQRQQAAVDFYTSMLEEVRPVYEQGRTLLARQLQ